MDRFTLLRDCWYACEFIGDEFESDRCSYSPIKVFEVAPLGDGTRSMRLDFFHACYPAGVQDKTYNLQTIERGERFMLARSVEHAPARFLQIYDIDAAWIRRHFEGIHQPNSSGELSVWLDRTFG
jgi:hypothetical protein